MILNIIDGRKRKYRWREITAIFEPTKHDNTCVDSDATQEKENFECSIGYHEEEKISLADALKCAQASQEYLTVYLYDLGQGINIASTKTD